MKYTKLLLNQHHYFSFFVHLNLWTELSRKTWQELWGCELEEKVTFGGLNPQDIH